MPIYEYKCISCSHIMEKILPFSESHSPQKCSACGSHADKILSASNIATGHAHPEKTEPTQQQSEASGIKIHNCKF
jgi:putative FmdB family regulatory protein